MKNKKNIILMIIIALVLMALITGVTYAAFSQTKAGATNTIQTGTITFSYTEPTSNVTLSSAYPMTDIVGKTSDYFEFTISASASGEQDVDYYIYYVLGSNNTMAASNIKIYLTTVINGVETEVNGYPKLASDSITYSTGYLLNSGTFATNSNTLSKTYRLRMWINQDYSDNSDSKTFAITVNTFGKSSISD